MKAVSKLVSEALHQRLKYQNIFVFSFEVSMRTVATDLILIEKIAINASDRTGKARLLGRSSDENFERFACRQLLGENPRPAPITGRLGSLYPKSIREARIN